MPNVAKVLKEEIERLARKEVRAQLSPLKKDNTKLKKQVRDLTKRVDSLKKRNTRLVKKVEPVIDEATAKEAEEMAERIRPTSKTIKNLRQRLSLTQADFASLLGVSPQSVTNWERKGGRLDRLHGKTLASIAEAMNMGAREARAKLEEIAPSRPATKKKSTAKAKKKRGKKGGRKSSK